MTNFETIEAYIAYLATRDIVVTAIELGDKLNYVVESSMFLSIEIRHDTRLNEFYVEISDNEVYASEAADFMADFKVAMGVVKTLNGFLKKETDV